MSRLIEPNLNGMSERQFKRKGQMNVTHDELAAELQALAKSVLDAFGPIAVLQGELMLRQQALEDHLGYVYVPKATPEAPAVSGNTGGDTAPSDTIAPFYAVCAECGGALTDCTHEPPSQSNVPTESEGGE